MNHAKLEKSVRLQELLAFLRMRGKYGATTKEILVHCEHVAAVSAAVAELRANGIGVECDAERSTASGATVYRYKVA